MTEGKSEQARGPDIGDLAGQLRQMQGMIRDAQEELSDDTLTVTGGGDDVKVVISGAQRVKSVQISRELLLSGDPDVVSNALVAAMNDAIEQSQALAARRLEEITGGIGIPGF